MFNINNGYLDFTVTSSNFYNSEASENYGGLIYASSLSKMTFNSNYISGSLAKEGQIMALIGSFIATMSSN